MQLFATIQLETIGAPVRLLVSFKRMNVQNYKACGSKVSA